MTRIGHILNLFFLLSFFSAAADTNPAVNLDFERISIGQGISQSDITAMVQDSTGFMWFATNNGLNRYDGYVFRTFKTDSRDSTSLSCNIVFSMVAADNRYLWIGTKDAVNRYDAFTDRFEQYEEAIDEYGSKVPLMRVNALCMTRDGELWGLMRGSVIHFDSISGTFRAGAVQNSTTGANLIVLNDLCESADGRLLIASNRGIHLLDRRTLDTELLFDPGNNDNSSRILSLFVDPRDRLIYAGGEDGVFVIDSLGRFVREIRCDNNPITKVSAMIRDSFGRLWLGSREKGLYVEDTDGSIANYRFDPRNDKTIGSDYVLSIYEDTSGVVWVGTSSGGVSKTYLFKKPFYTFKHGTRRRNSLSHNVVMSVYGADYDRIWAATKDGALNCLDLQTGVSENYRLDVDRSGEGFRIHDLNRKNEHELWLATNVGLWSFDMRTGLFNSSPVEGEFGDVRIRSMMYDDDGQLWLLSRQGGVYVVDRDRIVAHYSMGNMGLSDDYVRGICQDHRGDIWIGTRSGGVNRLRREDMAYENRIMRNIPGDSTSLSQDNISFIYEDARNRLWIGTWGGGLNLVTDRERMLVKVYNEQDGLCDNVVLGMVEDAEGLLWISTYNGLSCFDPDRDVFRNYTSADGLPSNEFMTGACSKTSDGRILFGTINGIVMFRPERVKDANVRPSRLAITGLSVNNREIRPGDMVGRRIVLDRSIYLADEIILPYNAGTIGLELASFSYGVPAQNRFAYRLDGLEDDWVQSGPNHYVTYSRLRPGRYTFMFRATNSDGVWTGNPCTLKITVIPPFWASHLAYVIYFLLAVGMGWGIWQIVRRKQKRRALDLEGQMKMENEQALYEAKMRFYTNLSHELRTPLALISGLIERVVDRLGKENPVEKQLTVMRRNTDRMLNLVNDLLDLKGIETGNRRLKPRRRELVSFIRAVWSYFGPEAESRGISVRFEMDRDRYDAILDFASTEKILYNLFSNALKFTKSLVRIALSVERCEDCESIVIRVSDDGPGIDEGEHEKIFYRFYQSEMNDSQVPGSGLGLNLALELAKLQGGTLTVSSRRGQGATFTLCLPSDITGGKDVGPMALETSVSEELVLRPDEMPSLVKERVPPLLLIVDDNDDMRYYLRDALSRDFRVEEAASGREAIEFARNRQPDLVVCDIMMPDMDGITVCRILKESSQTRKIPVVLITAKVAEDSRIEGLRGGADAYLIKPFTEEHLRALITNILKGRDSMRSVISREIIATPRKESIVSPQDKLLSRAMNLLEQHVADSDYDVDRLSFDLHMSRVHLYRQLKEIVGRSPSDFIRDFRLAKAADMLRQNKLDVSEITYMVGFGSPKYFSACFKKKYGLTPHEYASSNADRKTSESESETVEHE